MAPLSSLVTRLLQLASTFRAELPPRSNSQSSNVALNDRHIARQTTANFGETIFTDKGLTSTRIYLIDPHSALSIVPFTITDAGGSLHGCAPTVVSGITRCAGFTSPAHPATTSQPPEETQVSKTTLPQTSPSTTTFDDAAASAEAAAESASSAASDHSWSVSASSACANFVMPAASPRTSAIDYSYTCALDLKHVPTAAPWPKDAELFFFSKTNPMTGNDFADDFCDLVANIKIGPEQLGLTLTYPVGGTCLTWLDKKHGQCGTWEEKVAQYGHGVTFGLRWDPDDMPLCKEYLKLGTRIAGDNCKDLFHNHILGKKCRFGRTSGEIHEPFLYIGGSEWLECVTYTAVSVQRPPPTVWDKG